jgi:signal peptide peptidase SppA
MSRDFRHVLACIYERPLAILPAKFTEIEQVILARIRTGKGANWIDDDGRVMPEAAMPNKEEPFDRVNDVAVIPMFGTITQRPNMMSRYSGGCSAEEIGRACDMAAADRSIRAIVMDIDSPGGEVTGIESCAAKIASAARKKQCIAVANSMCCSGAYWLASQCSEIVVAPAGDVGSIGVMCAHVDQSKAEEMGGFKTSFIHAGKYKVEMSSSLPLSNDAKAHLQDQVDKLYDRFVRTVADGRGTTLKDVRDNYGQGRTLLDTDAVAAGMADRVATLEDVLSELLSNGPKGRSAAESQRLKRETAAQLAAKGIPTK